MIKVASYGHFFIAEKNSTLESTKLRANSIKNWRAQSIFFALNIELLVLSTTFAIGDLQELEETNEYSLYMKRLKLSLFRSGLI
eukprot:snap_masked-scaffold_6-processed-gene-1.33-mRNA-1 protein AED:1.00 eAED:1.00 QI:0/-1/0/0/-1/1/1/0/83